MVDVFKISLLAGAMALLTATPTFADTTLEQNKVLYELQERCGKAAADFLDRVKAGKVAGTLQGGGEGGLAMLGQAQEFDSRSHYSARFNKCFMWMRVALSSLGEEVSEEISVWDVNDSRKIASFFVNKIDHGKQTYAYGCWVLKPDYVNRFDLGDSIAAKSDFCAGSPELIPVQPSAWPKWNALIKPYMQDGD